MNLNGLQAFNQDLRKCEGLPLEECVIVFLFCHPYKIFTWFLLLEFANSNPVDGFNDGTLQLTFTELRQVGKLDVWCVMIMIVSCVVSVL